MILCITINMNQIIAIAIYVASKNTVIIILIIK